MKVQAWPSQLTDGVVTGGWNNQESVCKGRSQEVKVASIEMASNVSEDKGNPEKTRSRGRTIARGRRRLQRSEVRWEVRKVEEGAEGRGRRDDELFMGGERLICTGEEVHDKRQEGKNEVWAKRCAPQHNLKKRQATLPQLMRERAAFLPLSCGETPVHAEAHLVGQICKPASLSSGSPVILPSDSPTDDSQPTVGLAVFPDAAFLTSSVVILV
ncbi:hypothetical protein BR93DRAFT_616725 [Coniochaeta sp. PMI_546]|nr:hypothetical protein BR93DRAFT_616725 [Coniochaeta sp. PMI_546]